MYFEETKYPSIYKKSYWGYFKGKPDQSIIQARNHFITKYKIVRYNDKNCKYRLRTVNGNADLLRHQEFYEDIYGRIIHIYSEYNKTHELFKQIKPMYALNQNTGVRIIETTKSKKLLMKEIFQKIPDDIVSIIKQY